MAQSTSALSQLVVNFMDDAEAGVHEMVRVTRPGGLVGHARGTTLAETTLLRVFWDAAREVEPERSVAVTRGRSCAGAARAS